MPALGGVTTKRIKSFKNWLSAQGCEILPPTNEYELIRFRYKGGATGVVYKNATNSCYSTSSQDVNEAWNCYRECREWTGRIKGTSRGIGKSKTELLARDGNCCFYCGRALELSEMTIEHILSLIHGGNNRIENKAIACKPCNSQASHMAVVEKIAFRDRIRAEREATLVEIKSDHGTTAENISY